MEFSVLWSGLCMLYFAYCEMLGDISYTSYSTNPRLKKSDDDDDDDDDDE